VDNLDIDGNIMILNMETGNGKVGRRDEQRRKYSKMDKMAKYQLVRPLERMEVDRIPKKIFTQ